MENQVSLCLLSPARGFVEYDAISDTFTHIERDDPRVELVSGVHTKTEIHTVFGDSYLLLKFLEKSGLISILKSVFPKKEDYERVLAHVVHGIMRNGSRITCDNFIAKSFASYVLDDIPIYTHFEPIVFFLA